MAAGHSEQHSIRVDKANLLAIAHKGYGLALHKRDANLVGEQAHHG